MFKSAVADGLLTSEGDTWRQQRRLMQPAFHQQRIANLDALITAATAGMLDHWRASAGRSQPVEIAGEMASLTLTITTNALFGTDLGDEVGSVGQAVNMGAGLLEKPNNARFCPLQERPPGHRRRGLPHDRPAPPFKPR